MTVVSNELFPNMEITIGDDLTAYTKIGSSLPHRQGEIIRAMSMCSGLIQVYCFDRRKIIWDMTGPNGVIPHLASVKALVRRNLIIPIISNKEWEVQIALGTADERTWQLNRAVLNPLQNAICLIRTIEEHLEGGGKFNVVM